MSTTLITSRDPKGLHIVGLFEAVLNKAGLDDERAQRLIENGGDFQTSLRGALENHSATNQFADEEVKSSYGYLSGYTKSKDLIWQTNRLRELIHGVGYACEDIPQRLALPVGAEGWFAIPRWQKVAPTYHEAVQRVLDIIKQTRNGKFYNYRDGQIDAQHLRQFQKTAEMFRSLGEQQKDNDILVVPCQFGKRHAGRSVRRAREVMNAEFGLDAFSIGIMILTHPERLQNYNDLWIDCAGDEFSVGGDSLFGHAPCFLFNDAEVEFDTFTIGLAYGHCGSSSAFAPQ